MTLRGLFTDIADAIRGKDGTSAPIGAEDFPERIAAIPSGGGGRTEQPQKDVNFIDFDGLILHSYTAAEFAALTALPANPDHSSDITWGGHTIPLTSQGWNWSLANAQAYVAKYGRLWIGQMYKTTDGKLHLCVRMGEGRLKPASRFTFTGTATIDWGDGTGAQTAVSAADNEHTYAAPGDYDVQIAVSGGALSVTGSSSGNRLFYTKDATTAKIALRYANCVIAMFIPEATTIGLRGLYDMRSMAYLTSPRGLVKFDNYAMCACYSLRAVTIPDGTSIGTNLFNECRSLQIASFPKNVTQIDTNTFYRCNAIRQVALPDAVVGSGAFQDADALQSITIPDGKTIRGSAFDKCASLGAIRFVSASPNHVENINAWSNIASDCIIYVPAASLDAYKTATNYPSPSTYTYIGY